MSNFKERFSRKFPYESLCCNGDYCEARCHDKREERILDFIEEEISNARTDEAEHCNRCTDLARSQERQRICELIEKMEHSGEEHAAAMLVESGYNQALVDFLSKIRGEEGNCGKFCPTDCEAIHETPSDYRLKIQSGIQEEIECCVLCHRFKQKPEEPVGNTCVDKGCKCHKPRTEGNCGKLCSIDCEGIHEIPRIEETEKEGASFSGRERKIEECLREAIDLVEDIRAGGYKPDSFTTQPWRAALRESPTPQSREQSTGGNWEGNYPESEFWRLVDDIRHAEPGWDVTRKSDKLRDYMREKTNQ